MIRNTVRKWSIFATAALICIGLCLICGCTGESGQPETITPTATPAGSVTSPAGAGAVTAVHFTELYQFFPTPTSNWVAEDPFGYSVASDGMSWSWAERTYQHKIDDITVDIVIQDTAETREGYWEMWDTFSGSIDTPDISMKSTTVQGYPAWVVHDKAANTYTQFVAINDRFIVWTNIEGSSAKETHLTVFNNQMDITRIAGLA